MSEEVEIIESERLNKEPDGAEVVDQNDAPIVTEIEEPTKSDNEETAEDIIEEISKEEEQPADPLSIENENHKELELMNDISTLQTDLKEAESKANTLQQQLHAMEKYKSVADSFMTISEGATDPVIWFQSVMKMEKEETLKVTVKNQELIKKIERLERERNDSVVKNAKIEKSILDAKKKADNADKEAKKAKQSDEKARAEAERCRKMSNQAIKEHATMKEHYTNNLNKLKWTENKLQAENEALALEREKNAKLIRDLKEAREETTQIRANTQQIISTYQNSEEVRSNALDGELKSLKEQFESMKTQRDEFDAQLTEKKQHLDEINAKLLDAENKVACLETERVQLTEERDTMAVTLNQQKGDLTDMGSRLAQTQKRLDEAELAREELTSELCVANERAQDRESQAADLAGRESELLATVAQLTESNNQLLNRVKQSDEECGSLKHANTELEKTKEILAQIETKFTDLESSSSSTIEKLKSELSSTSVEAETASNRMRALEKQNGTLKKELRAALCSAKSNSSSMARSQSINSIESIEKDKVTSQTSTPAQSPRPERSQISFDNGLNSMAKNDIIQKLVNVQKQYVKRNEKIDFLSDHVAQLTEELKKKTKLIQSFLLREQHGRMKPPGREQEVHRKVNLIMDSIYAPNSNDNINMLKEVNKQLQLVLEDTLFKNIMQQDNIKHLGEEIDKIQRRCKCKPNTR